MVSLHPMRARPLALTGFLPAWDLDRRHCDVSALVEWTLQRLALEGLQTPSLKSIRVEGQRALELATRLTKASVEAEFRHRFHAVLRKVLPELPWERVWAQTYAHFRILVPGDTRGVVRAHTDFGFAHGLDERNVWIALTDATGPSALHILPFRESMNIVSKSEPIAAIYDVDALVPVSVECGDVVLFTPLHVHGARPPQNAARVSIDVRITPAKASPPDLSFAPLREAS